MRKERDRDRQSETERQIESGSSKCKRAGSNAPPSKCESKSVREKQNKR